MTDRVDRWLRAAMLFMVAFSVGLLITAASSPSDTQIEKAINKQTAATKSVAAELRKIREVLSKHEKK